MVVIDPRMAGFVTITTPIPNDTAIITETLAWSAGSCVAIRREEGTGPASIPVAAFRISRSLGPMMVRARGLTSRRAASDALTHPWLQPHRVIVIPKPDSRIRAAPTGPGPPLR